MKSKKCNVVVAAFHDATRAQEAIRALKTAGFTDDQIGVVSHDKSGGMKTSGTADKGTHAAEGAAAGLATGAGVGALWALGIAAGIMPVIGPVVAGGLLGSVLASAAGGAAIAGVVGALIGLGIPEEDAEYYNTEFKAGRTLVTVKCDTRRDEAWKILHSYGAYNRETGSTTAATASVNTAHTSHTAGTMNSASSRSEMGETVQAREEELHARKSKEQVGDVRVRKEVTTETQTIHVPVTKEEIVIERRPVSKHATDAEIKAGTTEIHIPVSEERVHVEKETVVKEEVKVGKRKVTDTEEVTGTVRKEKVKVETDGKVKVTGSRDPKDAA